MHVVCRLFVRPLRAGVQSTLNPGDETFISVQCASPGRGGELVGVCVRCMCALSRVDEGTVGVSSSSGIFKSVLPLCHAANRAMS